jgi:nitrogen fixation protein
VARGIKRANNVRKALEEVKDKKHELIDGVKVYINNGWVLLVSDTN